jgi:prepilin-type N-terminal cleavage/methylation domain-containing protein
MKKGLNRGFTMMEVLMGLVIIGILVTIVSLAFGKVNSGQALEKAASSALSVLDEARTMTLSSVDGSQYGVRIEDAQLVLFRGASYSAADPENVPSALNPLVGVRNVSLAGGGSSVVFQRLTGATTQYGSFEIYLRAATTTYKRITVSATGVSEEN